MVPHQSNSLLPNNGIQQTMTSRAIAAANGTSQATYGVDAAASVAKLTPQRRRGVRRIKSSSHDGGSRSGGSLLWTVFVLGLLFCLFDLFYMIKYINDDRHVSFRLDRIASRFRALSPVQIDQVESAGDDDAHSDADPDTKLAPGDTKGVFERDPSNVDPSAKLATGATNDAVEKIAMRRMDLEKDEEIPDDPRNKEEHHMHRKHKMPDASTKFSATEWGELTRDKEPIVKLLQQAGFDLTREMLEQIPTWTDVTSLYGDKPVFYGLDNCAKFQASGIAAEHFVSTAGTFNTGTNLMAELLIHNCHMPARMEAYGKSQRGVRWQVVWGKHNPVGNETFRRHHSVYNVSDLTADNIFPAVTIRDPYKWMQSMCRHRYGAFWNHRDEHCPNLVPDDEDKKEFPIMAGKESVPVHVHYKEFAVWHDSLASFWSEWYDQYMKATFPFLLVRFEDVIFHPKTVTKTVCECAGGKMNSDDTFHYIVDSAKRGDSAHGKVKTSYIEAIVKYGTEKGRYAGFQPADLEYARQHLDPTIMSTFNYRHAPVELAAAAAVA